MAAPPSLVARAVLAVVLMVGFYILALAVALGLFLVPVLEIAVAKQVHPQLVIICVIGGLVVLWSIVPRPDRFNPPGPRLTPEQHPRLFAEIESVAKATGQEMPVEVYLDPEVNAWVAQRGGLMGFGSRRVMGIGLPLMAAISTPQLRAVLAHEFGHYSAGDTKLGPWVYKTRGAIIRTIQNLAKSGRRFLPYIFVGYGKLYLRITHAISRRQELAADALAVRVAGAAAHAGALRTIHRAGIGFNAYVGNELNPVLGAGYLPPVAAGFTQFMAASSVATAVDDVLAKELREAKSDPYDTHPALRERLAAIGDVVGQVAPSEGAVPVSRSGETGAAPFAPKGTDPTPALALLNDVPMLEVQLVSVMIKKPLKPLDWRAVATQVYVPMWQDHLKAHGGGLKGVRPPDLPALVTNATAFANRFTTTQGTPEERTRIAFGIAGAALALALHRQGWTLEADPGAEVALRKGDAVINAFEVIPRMADGTIKAVAWRQTCDEVGLSQVDLGTV
jgi:heat shock protein HtpX